MLRYRIKLINAFTKESVLTPFSFKKKDEAIEWGMKWRASGDEMDCEILDTHKQNQVIEF